MVERSVQGPHPSRLWLGERGRGILYTGAWASLSRLAGLLNLFVTLPFVLHALGPDRFGVWVTLVSMVVFANFLDFGFGNGTMNLIAGAQGRGAADEAKMVYRAGRRALLQVATALAPLMAAALFLVPWQRLLGSQLVAPGEAQGAAGLVMLAVVLGVPLNLAARVQLGLGHGNRAFRWQALGQTMAAVLVIALAHRGANLVTLTAAAVLTPLLGSAASMLQLKFSPELRGMNLVQVPASLTMRIRKEGALFFVLQLAAATAYSLDLPLISALSGSEAAGEYAIVQRLFGLVAMGLALIWVPLWPAYRHALAAGDHGWVIRTLRKSLAAGMLTALVTSVLIALLFEPFTAIWLQRPLLVATPLLVGFVIWNTLDAAATGIATFLNAASIMRFQVIVASAFAITCLGTKALALVHLGTWALPYATALTFVAANLIPTLLHRRRLVTHALSARY